MKKILLLVLLGCLTVISTSVLAADPNDNYICYVQSNDFYGCFSFWDDFTPGKTPYQRRAPGLPYWYHTKGMLVKINIEKSNRVKNIHLSGYSEGSPYATIDKVQAGSTIQAWGPASGKPHYYIIANDSRCKAKPPSSAWLRALASF